MSRGKAFTWSPGPRFWLFRRPQLELRHVGTKRQLNLQMGAISVLVIVLGNPLSHFAGAEADHGVGASVVIGIAPKNFNAQGTFF